MINVTVSVDTSGFYRMMSDMPGALARAKRKALEDIGARVASEATRAFRESKLRPSPWAPRKDKTSKHPLLIKSGLLWRSFRSRVTGPDTVTVGSDREYAKYHQLGTKKMPARPFYPVDRFGRLTPRIARKINADVEMAFAAEMKKLGG